MSDPTYIDATDEETALVEQHIADNGQPPRGYAYNALWPERVRKILAEVTMPELSPSESFLNDKIDAITPTEPGTAVRGVSSESAPVKEEVYSAEEIDDLLTDFVAAADLAAHAADPSTHGVSSAIVGTDENQTLLNKALTAPTIANFVNAQHDHGDADSGGPVPSTSISGTMTTAQIGDTTITPAKLHSSTYGASGAATTLSRSDHVHTDVRNMVFEMNNNGVAIPTGAKPMLDFVPDFAGKITGWTVKSDGNIVLDVWKDVVGNLPLTDSDRIAGTEKPTVTANGFGSDLTLTTWSNNGDFAARDCIGVEVESAAATWFKLMLRFEKSV